MDVLKHDFLPEDLDHELVACGIDGSVVVQARQSLAETEWLLSCADASSTILGVVGWASLTADDFPAVLNDLVRHKKLKGLRHVIQDEPDAGFMRGKAFNRGIAALRHTGLVYDLLIREAHFPEANEFVKRHPGQAFVLDHLGKPIIRSGHFETWRDGLFRLAQNESVACKLSGLVTEAEWQSWTPEGLHVYLDAALEAFGPQRLMAGSDWPVCLLASTYKKWWETLFEWMEALPVEARQQILGGTAIRVYKLE